MMALFTIPFYTYYSNGDSIVSDLVVCPPERKTLLGRKKISFAKRTELMQSSCDLQYNALSDFFVGNLKVNCLLSSDRQDRFSVFGGFYNAKILPYEANCIRWRASARCPLACLQY